MKALIKKCAIFFLLLMGTLHVHAAKLVYQQSVQTQKADGVVGLPRVKRKLLVHGYCRSYNIPTGLFLLFIYFVQDNPLQYKNKPLPDDLAEQDLSGYDFTGCSFTYTNLTDISLACVILTNTTCDYQKAFQDNVNKNKLQGGDWYQNNLPNDLKSIATVYPKLNNNTDKTKLLHIACGISRLPFYEGSEFYIKVAYWSSELLQLKQALGNPYGKQLVCSLQGGLQYDVKNYCWITNYPQDALSISAKTPHGNFDTYLKDFTSGLTNYQCKSTKSWGFHWYKDNIIENIEGLAATYPHIKEAALRQEACDIAHVLSKSYQIQKDTFFFHYLFCQHRLIRLKKLVGVDAKNKVHYSNEEKWYCYRCWRRSEK